MGIPLSSSFDVNAQIPLEERRVKNTLVDRDGIPTIQRHEGLEVYVKETGKFYTLVGGILNSNWQERSNVSKISELYDPTLTYKRVETDSSGNILINGNLVINGSTYETHAEKLYTTRDEIILRDGATSGLGSNYAGLIAKLYDGVNDGRLVFDSNGVARVGDVGNEQPLTTRIELPTNGHFAYWESANFRLNFKSLTISDIYNLQTILDGKASTSHTHSFSEITSKPTTLSGYGITDAQPLDGDLTAIANLTGTSGFLKKTAANTWTLDTNTYALSNHNHNDVYEPIISQGLSNQVWKGNKTWGSVAWSELTGVPSTFPPSTHTHAISDVTNLQSVLDGKLNTSEVVTSPTANKVLRLDANSKLPASITGNADGNAGTATKLITARTLTIGNTGKSFDGSANVSWTLGEIGAASASHTHAIADVTGLQTALDGKLNTSEVVTTATANKVLRLDANSKLPASITGNADGNAGTATKLATARTLTIGNTGKSFDGSANVSWTLSEIGAAASSHNHTNLTPYASNSHTLDTGVAKWIRIATSSVNVSRCEALFEVEYQVNSYHGRVAFRACSLFNASDSVRISKEFSSHYVQNANHVIRTVRVVFYPGVYVGHYAYVELYVQNFGPSTLTVNVTMVNGIGWTLTTGDGSIPTNYSSKSLSLMPGIQKYSTNDMRTVVSPSSGTLNINALLDHNNVVASITQNTTINISNISDGYMGSILLILNGTYSLTIGNITNEGGTSCTKHLIGTLTSLSSGYYLLTYRNIPDNSGVPRCFISISPKFTNL